MSQGIKESKEVLVFTKLLAVFIAKQLQDGAGVDDLLALGQKILLDLEFRDAALAAVADISKVGAEVSDLDAKEVGELGVMGIEIVVSVLSALEAKKV
jgi:hypothetical protein